MPQKGERRKFGTQIGEWDGQGWKPVTLTPNQEPTPAPAPKPRLGGELGQLIQDQEQGGQAGFDSSLLPMAGGALGGALGNIPGAALGGAAGEAARQLVNRAQGKDAPATPLAAATDIGTSGAMQGAMQGAGQLVIGAMAKTAPWLMAKAIRPSAALLKDYRTTAHGIAKTLLDDGINVSQNGLEKLQKLIFSDNAEIQALVNASPKAISKDLVLGRVDQHAMEAMKSQVNPSKALSAATKVADEFTNHPYYKGETITTPQAQRLKVGTYQEIGDAFNKPQKAKALKAVARGLKEEVAEATPGVAEINAREARRLAGGEAVASMVQKDASADPMGLLFASTNPTLFLAGLINKQPAVKSMLARGMYSVAAKAAGVPENAIRTAVFALANGQEDEK